MSDTTPSTTGDALPPGHPASADHMITAGEVLSGRGQGTGGEIESEGIDERIHDLDQIGDAHPGTGPIDPVGDDPGRNS